MATRMSTPRAGLHLRVLAHAAEDDGVAERQVGAVGPEALADLDRQLARGREDQGAGTLRSAGCGWRKPCRIGSANAAVLPVPVWAPPSRSRPSRTAGWPAPGWGSGWCSPAFRARRIGSASRRSVKDVTVKGSFGALTARCRAALWC